MKLMKLNIQLFGASTSKSTNLYSNAYPSSYPFTLTASIVENSTNVNSNTSSITVTGELKANGSYWSTSAPYSSTIDVYWYDNKTNTQTWKTSITFPGLNNKYDSRSASTIFDVEHNADGTLSGYCRVVFSKGATTVSYAPNSGEVSTDWIGLTTIPRTSSVSATDSNIGGNTSITINRASGSFTHTLAYSFGSLSGIIATGVATNYTWTVPTTFFAQIPNAKSGVCTITCSTYNGGTLIGTSTTTFNAIVDENTYKPQISGNVVDVNQDTIDLTGDNTVLVRGYSAPSVSYSATAYASATIAQVKVNNNVVTSSPVVLSNTSNSYKLEAIDSRGYKGEVTITPTTIEYIGLTISADFARVAPTTGEVGLSFSGNYFDDTFGTENNTLILQWEYKLKTDSNWTTGGTLVKDTDYVIVDNKYHSGTGNYQSVISLGNTFNYQNAYDFRIKYADKLVNKAVTQTVPKGQPIANWNDTKFNVNGVYKRNEAEFTKNSYNTSQNDTYSCDYINDNIKSAFELYSGNTTGDVTLSQSTSGFAYLEIFYRYNYALSSYIYSSVKVCSPYSYADLLISKPGSANTSRPQDINYILAMATVKIGTTKIEKAKYGEFSYGDYLDNNNIQIVKVLGYK